MTLHVTVAMPRIENDTVHFAWEQDAPNSFQSQNGFYCRYDDIDLTHFRSELLLEMMLVLQLPVWGRMADSVQVDLPVAIPERSARFWRTLYDTQHVSIGPLGDAPGSPWRVAPHPIGDASTAVFWGGGKDSLTMAGMLAEVQGADRVLLVRGYDPTPGGTPEQASRKRIRSLSLDPMQSKGFKVAEFSTDFSSHAMEGMFDQIRPGYDRYTAGALPSLISYGITVSVLGLTWLDFYHFPLKEGGVRAVRHRWRPEGLQALGRHLHRTYGFDHQPCDFNMLLNNTSTYRLLLHRYPDIAEFQISCNKGGDQRWCANCNKCFHLMRYTLAEGVLSPDFDYERFLTSHWVRLVLNRAAEMPRTPGGNVVFDHRQDPELTTKWHYIDFQNSMSRVDPLLIADRLSDKALRNLAMLLHYFGNEFDPRFDVVPGEVIDRLPQPLGRQLAEIAGTMTPIVERLDSPLKVAGNLNYYALDEVLPHPVLDLD